MAVLSTCRLPHCVEMMNKLSSICLCRLKLHISEMQQAVRARGVSCYPLQSLLRKGVFSKPWGSLLCAQAPLSAFLCGGGTDKKTACLQTHP